MGLTVLATKGNRANEVSSSHRVHSKQSLSQRTQTTGQVIVYEEVNNILLCVSWIHYMRLIVYFVVFMSLPINLQSLLNREVARVCYAVQRLSVCSGVDKPGHVSCNSWSYMVSTHSVCKAHVLL